MKTKYHNMSYMKRSWTNNAYYDDCFKLWPEEGKLRVLFIKSTLSITLVAFRAIQVVVLKVEGGNQMYYYFFLTPPNTKQCCMKFGCVVGKQTFNSILAFSFEKKERYSTFTRNTVAQWYIVIWQISNSCHTFPPFIGTWNATFLKLFCVEKLPSDWI